MSLLQKRFIIVFVFLVGLDCLSPAAALENCEVWFAKSKIKRDHVDCEVDCSTLLTDISTTECPFLCKQLCDTKCEINPFWKGLIKNGRPQDWDTKKEITTDWSKSEKERVLEGLSIFPQALEIKSLQGIYRMIRSITPGNPASSFKDQIVLYDIAFSSYYSLDRVMAHEFAHILFENMNTKKQDAYRKATGWKVDKAVGKVAFKPGRKFIESDGSESVEEDFANNLESYLFKASQLKQTSPDAFRWIENNFPKPLELRKGCRDEKEK